MQILDTTVENPNIGIMILGLLLIAASFYVLSIGIKYWKKWKFNAIVVLLLVGFIVLAGIGGGILKNNFMKRRTVYTVLIRNDKDVPELLEDYEIIKQTGRIYTIREKDREIMKDVVHDIDEKAFGDKK